MSSAIYELKYSGREVDGAIDKINSFDPSNVSGGIIELESSEANPYNLDFLRSIGLYKAAFVYTLSCPSGVEHCSPVFIFVFKVKDETPNGRLIQSLYAGDATFNRSSIDAGVSWDHWESKDGLDKAIEITPNEISQIYDAVFQLETLNYENRVAISAMVSGAKSIFSTMPTKHVSC